MDGQWMINKLYLLNSDGFKTIVEPNGTITFHTDGEKGPNGTYTMDFNYITPTADTVNVQLSGTFTQTSKTDFEFTREGAGNYRTIVPYFAKKDLEFQIPNLDYTSYNFFLKK